MGGGILKNMGYALENIKTAKLIFEFKKSKSWLKRRLI